MYVGLCGVLDGVKENDFTKADGTVYVHADATDRFPNEFTRTWRYVTTPFSLTDIAGCHVKHQDSLAIVSADNDNFTIKC